MAFVDPHWPFWPLIFSKTVLKPRFIKKHSKSNNLKLSKISNNFHRILVNLYEYGTACVKKEHDGHDVSQEGELAKKTINIKRQHFG